MYSILRIIDHDPCTQSARELTAATWGQELAVALKQANVWIQDPEEEELGTKADRKRAMEFGKNVKVALREVWIDPATDVFDIGFVVVPFGPFYVTYYEGGIVLKTTSSV